MQLKKHPFNNLLKLIDIWNSYITSVISLKYSWTDSKTSVDLLLSQIPLKLDLDFGKVSAKSRE